MHRSHTLALLDQYVKVYPEERENYDAFLQFIQKTPSCFDRSHLAGHITGSSFILSPDKKALLLAFHAKLKRWLQPGGHADGDPKVDNVALREAYEESGLEHLRFFPQTPIPLDLDIHVIPESSKAPTHLHYDVRFLFISKNLDCKCSNESLELKWIPISEISNYCAEPSMLRAMEKIHKILSHKNKRKELETAFSR